MCFGDENQITENNREMSTDKGSIDQHCLEKKLLNSGAKTECFSWSCQ